MPEIGLKDLLDYGLSYVLAFIMISCFLWYFFRIRPAEERERCRVRDEMVRQSALCVQAVEAVARSMEQNARAIEGVQEALEIVARQGSVMLDMQRRLYAEAVRCSVQADGLRKEKTS